MSIEAIAGKQALKYGAKFWTWYRVWRTNLAYKREVKKEIARRGEQIVKLAVVAVMVAFLSGCASLDKVYTSVDRTVYNGQLDPYQNQIPEGYKMKVVVMDATSRPVDITGWTVEHEMIRAENWKPIPLQIKATRQGSAVQEAIQTAKDLATGSGDAESSSDNSDLMQDVIEGLK